MIGKIATVSGWGRTGQEQPSTPLILQEAKVEIISNDECERWFKDAGQSQTMYDVFLCAGYKQVFFFL